jgi:cytochrome oxidase assembly protein ShyY1
VLRTLRQPRWVALTVVVIAVSLLFGRLGLWQWHRAQAKWRLNDAVATRAHESPVPAQSVIAADHEAAKAQEWRRVTATGTYDTGHTVLRRDQTLNGARGYDVLVPLRVPGGPGLLVNRGFVPAPDTGGVSATPDVPAPPPGTVTVTGLVRRPSHATLRLDRTAALPSVRAVDPQRIAAATGQGATLDGYVMRVGESPAPATVPAPPDLPQEDVGLNLAYMVQWWLFILIALAGWYVLLRREAQEETHDHQDAPPRRVPVQRV